MQDTSRFHLFTRVHGMSENMETMNIENNNILIIYVKKTIQYINVSVPRGHHYGWRRRKMLDFSLSRSLENEI